MQKQEILKKCIVLPTLMKASKATSERPTVKHFHPALLFLIVVLQGIAPKLAKGKIASLSGAEDDARYFQPSYPRTFLRECSQLVTRLTHR